MKQKLDVWFSFWIRSSNTEGQLSSDIKKWYTFLAPLETGSIFADNSIVWRWYSDTENNH